MTAQRRSERLRDVPASITAIPAQTLARAGVRSTAEIAKLSPGVNLPFYGNFLQPSIRGVSSTGANVGESSNVALYIDGIYQPQQIATLFELPDVSQVEILKGPQGALYGQDATGGAILVTSKAPSFTPAGNASISYGNYNDVNLRGYVTGPLLGNVLAGSLAGGYETRDGFRRQVLTGQQDSGVDSKLIRGKLLYQPNDAVHVTLAGYYSDLKTSDQNSGFAYDGNSSGYALYPAAPKATNSSEFAATPGVFTRIKSAGVNLHGSFDTTYGTVNEIAAYASNHVSYLTDVDESPVDYATATTSSLRGHYFTNEVNFVSRKFGPVSFLAGFFFLKGADTFDPSAFNLSLAPSLPPAPQGPQYSLSEYLKLSKEIYAGYAGITYQILPSLVLSVDGRYTTERERGYNNFGSVTVGGFNLVPGNIIYQYPGNPVTFKKFTPRVTLRYAINPDNNVYFSFSQGFKSGNINLSGTVPPGGSCSGPNASTFCLPPVKPETINAYEIGWKGRLLPTLTGSAAAFYYDYSNLQLVQYSPPNYTEQNAASATIKGIDFDASWHPLDDWTFSLGGSVLDGQYGGNSFASAFVAATPTLANGFAVNTEPTIALDGRQMIRAPHFTGNFTVNYDHDFPLGHFGAYALAYYNSGYPMEISDHIRQPSYATLDTELSFSPNALPRARFVLWGKNLNGADYLASILQSQFADGAVYAAPRTYGFRVEYGF